MSDLSVQLQQLMQRMMQPQPMMNIDTGIDGKQGGPNPNASTSADWQKALNPKGDSPAMGHLADLAGSKNTAEGIAAASKLVGK